MKLFRVVLCLFLVLIAARSSAQGCLIRNYDPYNKVFNYLTSSRTFAPGNGKNFVLWEGVCGPHTYIQLLSPRNGNCTVTGIGTGEYYPIVSTPFTAPCALPLDDYIWVMILFAGGISYALIRKNRLSIVQ